MIFKKSALLFFITISCIALTNGCKTLEIKPEQVYLIEPGKTTVSELIALYGEPVETTQLRGKKILLWRATKGKRSRTQSLGVTIKINTAPNVLYVLFDDKEIVDDFALNPVGDVMRAFKRVER